MPKIIGVAPELFTGLLDSDTQPYARSFIRDGVVVRVVVRQLP